MSLLAIKSHMMTVKMASLSSLCLLFNMNADQLRCMLQHWIRKGKMRQCMKPACGSTCFKCPVGVREIYEWVSQ